MREKFNLAKRSKSYSQHFHKKRAKQSHIKAGFTHLKVISDIFRGKKYEKYVKEQERGTLLLFKMQFGITSFGES